MTEAVLARLADIRVVPVVVIDDAARAPDLATALTEGGIPCAEITLRTPAGLSAIAASSGSGFLVGGGTVLTVEEVDRCAEGGAQFVVSPGFDRDVVERAQTLDLLVLPGVATATELQYAIRAGLHAVKYFPAEKLGGVSGLRALAGPFPDVRFMPSGGVDVSNVRGYLADPSVFAVGGSWMVPRDLIERGDFATITSLTAHASALVHGTVAP